MFKPQEKGCSVLVAVSHPSMHYLLQMPLYGRGVLAGLTSVTSMSFCVFTGLAPQLVRVRCSEGLYAVDLPSHIVLPKVGDCLKELQMTVNKVAACLEGQQQMSDTMLSSHPCSSA